MTEINVVSPGEIFEPSHAAQEKVEHSEREYMLAEVGELASHWETTINQVVDHGGDWSTLRQEIYNNYQIQSELRDQYDDTPTVQRAFDKVNFLFGTLPGNYIDPMMNIVRNSPEERYPREKLEMVQAGNPELSSEESHLRATEWHNEAIWSLLRMRNSEIISSETASTPIGKTEVVHPARSFPEILIPTMAKLFHKAIPSSHMASLELGASLSGIYGAVRMARTARQAGHRVYLPPAPWDAFGKVDLILTDEERKIVAPTQIKSTTKPGGAQSLIPNAPGIEFGGSEVAPSKDWLALKSFCEQIANNPEWRAKGYQIEPKWANIYDARTDIEGFTTLVASAPSARDASLVRI